MLKCVLCGKEQKSSMNLSKHLSNNHRYSPKEYYDLYLKKENEDKCVICGNQTKYLQFTKGHNSTCSRKCGAILFRQELKRDEDRFESFRNIVSANQKRIWEEREENGTAIIIRDQIGQTMKENNVLLTVNERKEKYGWLSKLTNDKKEHWKRDVMFKTGAHLFWKNATDEDKRKVYRKINASKLRVTEEIIANLENNLQDKNLYYEAVGYLTSITYNRHREILDKDLRRGNGYDLDHRYSVIKGFINKIPPEIISSIYNLEIIPTKINQQKNSDCSITKEYLLEIYYG